MGLPARHRPGAGFTDVPGDERFAADCLAVRGVTQGVTPTELRPRVAVARCTTAVFLARVAEERGLALDTSGAGLTDLEDVPAAARRAVVVPGSRRPRLVAVNGVPLAAPQVSVVVSPGPGGTVSAVLDADAPGSARVVVHRLDPLRWRSLTDSLELSDDGLPVEPFGAGEEVTWVGSAAGPAAPLVSLTTQDGSERPRTATRRATSVRGRSATTSSSRTPRRCRSPRRPPTSRCPDPVPAPRLGAPPRDPATGPRPGTPPRDPLRAPAAPSG